MRKLQFVTVAALLAASSTAAIAQGGGGCGGGRGQGGAQQMQRMMEGITLSAEQQTKVDSIAKMFGDQRAALRNDATMDQDARRTKNREIMTKQNDAIKAVLTDEQKKVFDKNMADMQAQMQRPPEA